jgi:hypothetical protein
MNKLSYLFAPTLFAVLLITACDDFIEKDISDAEVSIISPPDSFRSASIFQTFWWNELDGAESYDIQIVKGTFSYVEQVIIDSSTSGTKFQYSLNPGSYQWRIRGVNNGSNTSYITRTLTIDSTLNLSAQTVVLLSPSNNLFTNDSSVEFSWQELYNATEYRIQIIDSLSGSILTDEIITGPPYSFQFNEGKYIWKVLAQNSISLSQYSQRTIHIDFTPPSPPFLTYPANNAIITAGLDDTLMWNSDSDILIDSVFIDDDSLFATPSKFSSSNMTLVSTFPNGIYFWKVKSFDYSGNESNFSSTRKFTYQ